MQVFYFTEVYTVCMAYLTKLWIIKALIYCLIYGGNFVSSLYQIEIG